MNQTLAVCLAVLLVLPALAAAAPELTHVDVFTSGQDGYAIYRIPALEVAPDGSLLVFAEARKYNGADPGMENNEIDLVLKRSTDGGRTWSPMRLIEHAGERWSAANPATVVDRTNHRVWVLYLRCKPGRDTDTSRPGTDDTLTLARYSDDCGLTWSEPRDITQVARDMNDPTWTCSVIGPGGAIQTRKGRLLFAAWKARPYVPYCVYSDDHGRTWHRGALVPGADGGNECQVVELADGQILMDIRQNGGPHRWLATSADGGQTWSTPRPGESVTPVACAIERLARPARGRPGTIVWTGPKGPDRRTLVARTSHDEGQTFGGERLIYDGPAAYSDLALLKDGRIGVLWERGDYRFLTFTALTREFMEPPAQHAAPAARWQDGTTTEFAGRRVLLSRPNLVARSRSYLWFPTLVHPRGKALFAVMSGYPDEATTQPVAMVARSTDGGLHWTAPREQAYGEVPVPLSNGDTVLLPYYMRLQPDGSLAGSYLRLRRGEQVWQPFAEGVTVRGWPRKLQLLPSDLGGKPEWGLGSFVFNGQTALARDGHTHLATLYGRFADTKRYSLVVAESADGFAWQIRSVVADETCKLEGAEGPCESALVRIKDGRLMCVYRVHSGLPYGQSFSSDDGATWSEPEAMRGPFSVQPSLVAMPDGTLVLSGGRPDLYLWVNRDGLGKEWDRVDVVANHNAFCSDDPIRRAGESPVPNTSSYTEIVPLDAHSLLLIYDRVPHGWAAIPSGSSDTNSVWVVRVTIR